MLRVARVLGLGPWMVLGFGFCGWGILSCALQSFETLAVWALGFQDLGAQPRRARKLVEGCT